MTFVGGLRWRVGRRARRCRSIAHASGAIALGFAAAAAACAADSVTAALPAARESTAGGSSPSPAWRFFLASGYDTFVQRYPLAGADTTETISEFEVVLGADSRTPGRSRHHWLLRPQLSVGSEMVRERVEAGYQFRPDGKLPRWRVDSRFLGRQFRPGTSYQLSSDNWEARLEARGVALGGARVAGELRLVGETLRFRQASPFEVSYDEVGVGLYARSGAGTAARWLIGARTARRMHPDSTAIDRTVVGAEVEYETPWLQAQSVRIYHRSERRAVRDETVRPSAWLHWTSGEYSRPAGPGRLEAELRSELWQYDQERTAYFDSWRLAGAVGYRGGGVSPAAWRLGLAAEWFEAGDTEETYAQYGVRVGGEVAGGALDALGTVEVGRRDHREPSRQAASASAGTEIGLRSDFSYWSVRLFLVWRLAARLSLDVAADYQPESHTEPQDNAAVAFATARVTWRW